jgi:hypothetical protein
MANNKTGFNYFNVDTDRFQDIKIKRLKKDFGCNGFAVYEYILNEIYRVKGCFLEWDENTAFDVADYWGLKETQVNEIVNYCCSVGLFNKALLSSGRILTSLSIQKRFVEMSIRAKRNDCKIPEKIRIIQEEYKIIQEESKLIPEGCDNSKVKESKVNREYKNILLSEIKISDFPQLKPEYFEIAKSFQLLFKRNLIDAGSATTIVDKAKGTWIDDIRLLIETDKYSIQNLRDVYQFLQKDTFWKQNILSTSKLREQMSKIKLKMHNGKGRSNHKEGTSWEQLASIVSGAISGE